MISNSDKPWEELLSVKLHKVKIEYRNSKIGYYDTEMNIAIRRLNITIMGPNIR